ncbi:hypothetical protein [Parazoarcus communis]|uniref:Uncharacterized protein n=1 Tax=Parazoarcus communis SWub3 = DSM 12120 TaxID=1121029 RepID=A0A323V297_9RHOO|nr:hypothetical protein [Parazoarcus communis]NMG70040.1 hypothetical protein [Parazoarcus communis SWub3 = DSM 12120]PZA18223.1 hypothetical protein DNK49_01410 [Azoarcus communis] [Parazoarcus communis SWub3 = DSM 12120]
MNTPPGKPYALPLSTWLLGIPGLVCLIAGLVLAAGDFSGHHPMLAEPGTAIVLIVSAVALLGSAAFPAVLKRLADNDRAATPGQ